MADPKGEEQWEEVEGEEEYYEEEEEEEDTTINNSEVVGKYKKVAIWCNETLQEIIAACKAGTSVSELCVLGDNAIQAKVATMYRGVEKGIAFPTSISVNNCVANNSPVPGEETKPQILADGDVVHIDLGIQVDGYPAVVAHTIIVGAETLPETPAGNVINAAYTALQTAVRKIRPGTNTYEITDVIEKIAEHFKVNAVEGVLGHMMKRYIMDGFRTIPCKRNPDHMVHEYAIDVAQVWTLDIAFSTGKGKLKEKDARPSIFKQSLDAEYKPKLDSARDLMREVDKKFQTFPFNVRNCENKKARLGLSELLKHDVVSPFPVLYEKDGEHVGHFKITVLVTPKKIERVTGIPAQKPAKANEPFTGELLEVSKLPFDLKKKA